MGLPLRPVDQHTILSTGISESAIAEKYYEPPLINIIKFACHACPDNVIKVTDACQGCLAHPCKEVCPKGAIDIINGRSIIDQEKCITVSYTHLDVYKRQADKSVASLK